MALVRIACKRRSGRATRARPNLSWGLRSALRGPSARNSHQSQIDAREWPTCCSRTTYPADQSWSVGGGVRRSRATVDLFEEIRREYEFGLASISGVARKFGVHRRMVREAIESAIPMRLPVKERPRPTIGPVAGFIDEVLETDRQAPRKQRHTAHRIWVRITRERPGYQIAESTVRQYVRQRKRTLGLRVVPEAFVPQQYAWGDEAKVDYVSEGKRVSDRFASNEPGVIEFVR